MRRLWLLLGLLSLGALLWYLIDSETSGLDDLGTSSEQEDRVGGRGEEARRTAAPKEGSPNSESSDVDAPHINVHAFPGELNAAWAVIETSLARGSDLDWQGGKVSADTASPRVRFVEVDLAKPWREDLDLDEGETLRGLLGGPGSLQSFLPEAMRPSPSAKASGRIEILDGQKASVAGIRVEQTVRLSKSLVLRFVCRTNAAGECPLLHEPDWFFHREYGARVICEGEFNPRSIETLPIDRDGRRILYLGRSAVRHRLELRRRSGAPYPVELEGTIMIMGRGEEVDFRTGPDGETEVFLPASAREVLVSLNDESKQVVPASDGPGATVTGRVSVQPQEPPLIQVHVAPTTMVRGRLVSRDEEFDPTAVPFAFGEGRGIVAKEDGSFEIPEVTNGYWEMSAPKGLQFDFEDLERRYGKLPEVRPGELPSIAADLSIARGGEALLLRVSDTSPSQHWTIPLGRPAEIRGSSRRRR